jgi:flagellar biosynthesis/type III secretory pathway chaperone
MLKGLPWLKPRLLSHNTRAPADAAIQAHKEAQHEGRMIDAQRTALAQVSAALPQHQGPCRYSHAGTNEGTARVGGQEAEVS